MSHLPVADRISRRRSAAPLEVIFLLITFASVEGDGDSALKAGDDELCNLHPWVTHQPATVKWPGPGFRSQAFPPPDMKVKRDLLLVRIGQKFLGYLVEGDDFSPPSPLLRGRSTVPR